MPDNFHGREHSLLIVQPYIPAYREPLFQGLRQELSSNNIHLTIAAALPHGSDAARGDDRTASVADFILTETRISVLGRSIRYRSLRSVLASQRPTHVIVEQAIGNLESMSLLIQPRMSASIRVGLWGQGKSYSTQANALEAQLKQRLTLRADWFFSYTHGGARHIEGYGFPGERVTILQNALDTAQLRESLAAVTEHERVSFMQDLGLEEGRTALFLGGVDERKGIGFLLDACRRIGQMLPGFCLLIGGAGEMSREVELAQASGAPLRYLGRLDGAAKAIALSSASLLMIPEWVGLVAVDSLAAGKPIVTTRHPSHSPEFEYLIDGHNALVVDHDIEAYAQAVSHLLLHDEDLSTLQSNAQRDGQSISLEDMVARFEKGILRWMSS